MTAMATDGNEVAIGIRWILDRLRTDTGAGGLRNVSSPLVTGIHNDPAPQGSGLPYVVVAFLSGDTVAADVGAHEVMAQARFQVKAIVAGVDVAPAIPVVRRIFARLQEQGGQYTTGTSVGSVLWCVRTALISYVEGAAIEAVRHHGHEYRLLVQSSTV
jgi:hypothetical protein